MWSTVGQVFNFLELYGLSLSQLQKDVRIPAHDISSPTHSVPVKLALCGRYVQSFELFYL